MYAFGNDHIYFLYCYLKALKMARMSLETRQRVITLYSHCYTVWEIQQRLREENCDISAHKDTNIVGNI